MVSTPPDNGSNSQVTSELARLNEEIDRLQLSNLLLRDEISSLKAEAHSYCEEVALCNRRLQTLESQVLKDTPALIVGREVRLRYLEHHRQRMGRAIGKQGYERIKAGSRAAHRGRPMVDAMLCLTGLMSDHETYRDLYGVAPREMWEKMDVPEIVAVTGFRASLQSDGKMTDQFRRLFERLLEALKKDESPAELKRGFKEDKVLQQCHDGLQDCYDKIVAENHH
jgi:hypothetical protein